MADAALFPPEFFRALERLARSRPGPAPGRRSLSRPGRSMAGFEHRAYRTGDELRRVDWRASARSAGLQVRQPEAERGGTTLLLLDRSASLAPASARRDRDQRRLALALAWLAVDAGGEAVLAAGAGPLRQCRGLERVQELQRALEGLPAPSGPAAGLPALPGGGARRRVFALGDPWVREEWWARLHGLARRGDEVEAVILVLPEEDEPPAEGLRLRCVEDGAELVAELGGGRSGFTRSWEAWLINLRERSRAAGCRPTELRCGGRGTGAAWILREAEGAGLV